MFSNSVKESNEISRMEMFGLYESLNSSCAQVDSDDAYLYANIMRVLLGTGRFYFTDSEIACMNNIICTYDCCDSNSFITDVKPILDAIIDCLDRDESRVILDDGTIGAIRVI